MPSQISLKLRIVSASLVYWPALLVNDLGDEERLRQEPLDPAGPVDDQLVVLGQLVDAEDRDDVLQLAVALEDRLDAAGDVVVLLADVLRVEDARASSRAGRPPGRCPSRRSTAPGTMKASRKPKVVAGAGSVRSSAGT